MQEHGTFKMSVANQVITLLVFGSWNIETTSRWCIEYKNHIDSIKAAPWARIMDLTHWELTTPDVWEAVDKVNSLANISNQQYDVVICSWSMQKQIVDRAHEMLTNVEIKFCNDLQEAQKWLSEKGM